MSMEKIYDRVSISYNQDFNQNLSSKIIQNSHQAAFNSIEKFTNANEINGHILSLGVGDAVTLTELKNQLGDARFHGLDISKNMLQKARQNMDISTYHGCIHETAKLVGKQKFALILAYFVTAYVPLAVTLNQATKVLQENGLISVLTNTMESFPHFQQLITTFAKSKNPLKFLAANYCKKILKKIYTPKDHESIMHIAKEHHYQILDGEQLTFELEFNSLIELEEFAFGGGWFVSALDVPWLPNRVINWLFRFIVKQFIIFPFKEKVVVSTFLLKK